MFEKFKSKMRSDKESHVKDEVINSFGVTEKNGRIFITHCGEAVREVTDMSMGDAINTLDMMRKDSYTWNLMHLK